MKSVHVKSALAIATIAAATQAYAIVPGYSTATGGGSATPVTASTMAQIQAAIDGYSGSGGLVINYTGNQDSLIAAAEANPCGQWSKAVTEVSIKSKSNISIIGANGSSANFGIRIKGTSSNIIIRNMKIGMIPGGGNNGDAIGIEGGSNMWLDHNELFSQNIYCPGTPGDDTAFDGLIDIKSAVDNITVSYNYIHDHHKVGLDGSSDSDSSVRHLTFAHNYYYNVGARLPLQRFGYVHTYNNYYNGITTSGINVRMGGNNLIEGNYFENALNPVTSRDSSTIGYWDLRNNNIMSPSDFGTYNITWDAGNSGTVNATSWTTTKAFPVSLPYSYTVDPALKVKCIAMASAGVGNGFKQDTDVIGGCGGSSSSSSSTASSSSSSKSSSSSSSSTSSSSSSKSSSSSSSSSSSGAPVLTGTGDYPNGFSKCADLGGTCSVTKGTGWVAFGRKGSWLLKNVGVGKSIACTVAAFGGEPNGNPDKCSFQN